MADGHVFENISFFNDCNLRNEAHHVLSLVDNIVNHLVNKDFKESGSVLIVHSVSDKLACYLTFWGRLIRILGVKLTCGSMEMSWVDLIKFLFKSLTVFVLLKFDEI